MQDDAINRIAEKVMGGGAPQQAAPPAQPAQPQPGQAPGQPQPQSKPQDKPTPASTQEKVAESTSPQTEGDRADEIPVEYEVEFGENDKRKLTPSQIKGTFERYAAMNRENAQMKPVMDVVRQLTTEAGADPKQIADFMQSALRAQAKNAKLGQQGQDDEGKKKGDDASDDPFKTWEMETGASLPPKYKEMLEGNQQLSGELQQMKEMMSQVLNASKGQHQGAQQAQQQAQQAQVGAIRQEIKNNLNKMAQGLGFSDEQAQDFMAFMGDRGYSFEDFVDPDLTMRVGQDFRNALQSGDFDRLKKIAEKRSAVAGQMGAAPTQGGGDAPQPSDSDQAFNRMVEKTMDKRMMR